MITQNPTATYEGIHIDNDDKSSTGEFYFTHQSGNFDIPSKTVTPLCYLIYSNKNTFQSCSGYFTKHTDAHLIENSKELVLVADTPFGFALRQCTWLCLRELCCSLQRSPTETEHASCHWEHSAHGPPGMELGLWQWKARKVSRGRVT